MEGCLHAGSDAYASGASRRTVDAVADTQATCETIPSSKSHVRAVCVAGLHRLRRHARVMCIGRPACAKCDDDDDVRVTISSAIAISRIERVDECSKSCVNKIEGCQHNEIRRGEEGTRVARRRLITACITALTRTLWKKASHVAIAYLQNNITV